MKKIYQTPAMEVYTANLETFLQEASPLQVMSSDKKASSTPDNARMESNRRSTVNEDGLRDWDINLW